MEKHWYYYLGAAGAGGIIFILLVVLIFILVRCRRRDRQYVMEKSVSSQLVEQCHATFSTERSPCRMPPVAEENEDEEALEASPTNKIILRSHTVNHKPYPAVAGVPETKRPATVVTGRGHLSLSSHVYDSIVLQGSPDGSRPSTTRGSASNGYVSLQEIGASSRVSSSSLHPATAFSSVERGSGRKTRSNTIASVRSSKTWVNIDAAKVERGRSTTLSQLYSRPDLSKKFYKRRKSPRPRSSSFSNIEELGVYFAGDAQFKELSALDKVRFVSDFNLSRGERLPPDGGSASDMSSSSVIDIT